MKNSPHMENLMHEIRKMPIFRQLVPQEAGIGWPIPLRKAGNVYVILPFFGLAHSKAESQTVLYPPFATLTVNWVNWVPVEYINLRFRNPLPQGDWEAQVGTFPHAAIASLSVGQYRERRNELLVMYDALMEALVHDNALAPEWEASFCSLLRLLMEPLLEPYYRALGPKFFDRFLPSVSATLPSQ
ncbi:hypothetical protein [Dictyobacter formicarum]|uniref:Uncharacterized protein n=1 Tax=Dictyobacter formicarum TaxID=2778368 RepID=A0ABQ3V8P1_9CHLR|nr:hypothetical protein [Dictyobacter formicarum]GHO82252.1 hypothetical protein KSZ_02580 [Dictyobacter formicarum]